MKRRHGLQGRGETRVVSDVLVRARRRRRQRGAAMVEGLIVIPFFMLILAGTMFVGGFYGTRIEAQGEARHQVWQLAVNDSCDSGANSTLEGLDMVDSADLGELSGSPLAALCDKDFGSVTYTHRDSFSTSGAFSFAADRITATATAPCNETPIPGDVAYEKAVEFLWDAYQTGGTIPGNATPPTSYPISTIFSFGLYGTGALGVSVY